MAFQFAGPLRAVVKTVSDAAAERRWGNKWPTSEQIAGGVSL